MWRHPLLDPAQQRVAGEVADLHEAAGDVEQDHQQPDARCEQRHEIVLRPERGQADPRRADDRAREAPSPPITAIETTKRVLDEEVALTGPNVRFTRRGDAAQTRDESANEQMPSARRAGDTVMPRRRARSRGRRRSCDRSVRAEMTDEEQHPHEQEQHEVVVSAVLGELERADVSVAPAPSTVPREERPVDRVHLGRDCERQGADREQQSEPGRADTDEHRDDAAIARDDQRSTETTEGSCPAGSASRASRCRPRAAATAAAVRAPRPANAICPRTVRPAHPVSTTTDTAHSAKREDRRPRLVAFGAVREQWQTIARRATRTRRRTGGVVSPTRCSSTARVPQRCAARIGSSLPRPAHRVADPRHEQQHGEEEHELHESRVARVVEEEHAVENPDEDRAERRTRNETMPPISAAAMPRRACRGRCHEVGRALIAAVSNTATVDRNPAIVQIAVDTSFGLMPVMRGDRRSSPRPGPHRRTRCARAATTGRA